MDAFWEKNQKTSSPKIFQYKKIMIPIQMTRSLLTAASPYQSKFLFDIQRYTFSEIDFDASISKTKSPQQILLFWEKLIGYTYCIDGAVNDIYISSSNTTMNTFTIPVQEQNNNHHIFYRNWNKMCAFLSHFGYITQLLDINDRL
jgi:hypothetical protein